MIRSASLQVILRRRTRNGPMCWQQSGSTTKLESFCRRSWHEDRNSGSLPTRLRSFIAYWAIAKMRFNGSLKLSANMPWDSPLFASIHIWKTYDPIHASITCCAELTKQFLSRVRVGLPHPKQDIDGQLIQPFIRQFLGSKLR